MPYLGIVTVRALLFMSYYSREWVLVNLAPLNYVKLFFHDLVEIFQRKLFLKLKTLFNAVIL